METMVADESSRIALLRAFLGESSPLDWQEEAACRTADTNLFFPDVSSSTRGVDGAWEEVRAARAICRTCPVRIDCLLYGLSERDGIWGGYPEKERRVARRLLRGNPETGAPGMSPRDVIALMDSGRLTAKGRPRIGKQYESRAAAM